MNDPCLECPIRLKRSRQCDDTTCVDKIVFEREKHDDQVRTEILDDIAQWIQKHNYPQSSGEHAPFIVTMIPLVDFIQSLRKGVP